MPPRTIYLISSRNASFQRAHFAIFVPSEANPAQGSLINVVGAPMTGYQLEFERNYSIPPENCEVVPIGQVDSSNVVDSTTITPNQGQTTNKDFTPQGNLEIAASQVPAPGVSANFMAPVKDVTNKRCQEWTMEYIRYLVSKGYLGSEAIQIVQYKRDAPDHGIGLQAMHR
ncbi:hypothetical protein PISL3812_06832 [Talaromyces islandicus]|uniref:Uncharacterized protein n=1 Tax=Talaromyces islandicus TaxID=28573 RepID=A0A0U1M2I1_TALIS|nr:hypothetical protein PISL3812_06832 [Talaromyces islandicus]